MSVLTLPQRHWRWGSVKAELSNTRHPSCPAMEEHRGESALFVCTCTPIKASLLYTQRP